MKEFTIKKVKKNTRCMLSNICRIGKRNYADYILIPRDVSISKGISFKKELLLQAIQNSPDEFKKEVTKALNKKSILDKKEESVLTREEEAKIKLENEIKAKIEIQKIEDEVNLPKVDVKTGNQITQDDVSNNITTETEIEPEPEPEPF